METQEYKIINWEDSNFIIYDKLKILEKISLCLKHIALANFKIEFYQKAALNNNFDDFHEKKAQNLIKVKAKLKEKIEQYKKAL